MPTADTTLTLTSKSWLKPKFLCTSDLKYNYTSVIKTHRELFKHLEARRGQLSFCHVGQPIWHSITFSPLEGHYRALLQHFFFLKHRSTRGWRQFPLGPPAPSLFLSALFTCSCSVSPRSQFKKKKKISRPLILVQFSVS